MRPPRRSLMLASALVTAAVPLLVAGCGDGSPRVARIGSSHAAKTTPANGLIAYVDCMRGHGVPSFPGPNSAGEVPKDKVEPLAGTPQFARADKDCQHLVPASGLGPPTTSASERARIAGELSFARCMRNHGLTNFPDPSAQSGLSVAMVQAQGIDVHSPAVLRAAQACVPASHGALSTATIRRALTDAGG